MDIHEGVVSQQEISIHNQCCWSVLADSPCQPACWVLEKGKLCTTHCHSIHTQPSPAPKALAPLPPNYLKDTKHMEIFHSFANVIYCYSFKHCNELVRPEDPLTIFLADSSRQDTGSRVQTHSEASHRQQKLSWVSLSGRCLFTSQSTKEAWALLHMFMISI